MKLLGYFSPIMPHRFVYMLQQVEYDGKKFLAWLIKRPNLLRVMRRKTLVLTKKAQILLLFGYALVAMILAAIIYLLIAEKWLEALGLFIIIPMIVAISLAAIVMLGNKVLYAVRKPLLEQARKQLTNHPATKIAILGSYGKTSMKEMLMTVLSEAKVVKATPGNMNVPISHARWITKEIDLDEQVIIFEYGEGEPGDIAKFANLTSPSLGIITGIAPNHLDRYKSIEVLADDLLAIRQYLPDDKLLMNADATRLHEIAPAIKTYDHSGVGQWEIKDIKVDYQGTSFLMTIGSETLQLKSGLLGKHHVGPLAAVVSIASETGLTNQQILEGVAKTRPFEHRMQERYSQGAWIIDDTYNGNLEGVRAGLQLMNDLTATRRIYITPGLVDQGTETIKVHRTIGQLIADAKPDLTVLMANSVTDYIREGLEDAGYKGKIHIEDDPLSYYTDLEHTLAAGDLVMMQNDWTDNYL